MAASNAADAHIAPSLHRSVAAPIGMIAARATQRICIQPTKAPGAAFQSSPAIKSGWAPAQLHGLPLIYMSRAGPPANPCQANPKIKYAMAATAVTHRDDIITCAALRERPKPLLISASPAMAKGIRRIMRNAGCVTRASGGAPDGSGTATPTPAPRPLTPSARTSLPPRWDAATVPPQ